MCTTYSTKCNDPVYGPTVKKYCPLTCGACKLSVSSTTTATTTTAVTATTTTSASTTTIYTCTNAPTCVSLSSDVCQKLPGVYLDMCPVLCNNCNGKETVLFTIRCLCNSFSLPHPRWLRCTEHIIKVSGDFYFEITFLIWRSRKYNRNASLHWPSMNLSTFKYIADLVPKSSSFSTIAVSCTYYRHAACNQSD